MALDFSILYADTGQAKLADLPAHDARTNGQVSLGADVAFTGPGRVWHYLRLVQTVHRCPRILSYNSPVPCPVEIFDHSPC